MYNLLQFVLFNQIIFCPLCGCTLVEYCEPTQRKVCLAGCGEAVVDDGPVGIPIVLFKVP